MVQFERPKYGAPSVPHPLASQILSIVMDAIPAPLQLVHADGFLCFGIINFDIAFRFY